MSARALIEEHLGRPVPDGTSAIALDPTVLFLAAGAGAIVAFILSLIPLARPWERKLGELLQGRTRTVNDERTAKNLRSTLCALEVAGALTLLAGCVIQSALNLVNADLGFKTGGIVRARVALPMRSYPGSVIAVILL